MRYRVNNLLYAAGEELLHTIRVDLELNDAVDPEVLTRAVNLAALRFPYYAVRLVREGEEYFMVPNPEPMAVLPEGSRIVLGDEGTGHHLFAFTYSGNKVSMHSSHFITDGNGLFPFLKTILYLYLKEIHPDESFGGSFALPGDEISPGESCDYPYPEHEMEEDPLVAAVRPDKVYMLSDQPAGYGNKDEWSAFFLSVRQDTLMKYVSGVDGSPASFIASLIFMAISDLDEGGDLPIVCGMQHQFRKALKRPVSHLCHVNIVPMVYPASVRGGSIERLNTMSRGILILRGSDENDILTINRHIRNEHMIRGMTLEEKHSYMLGEMLEGIGNNTFGVSYTGRVPWDGIDRYIKSVRPYFDMALSGGISAEIFSVGEYFDINIMQRSPTDRYVRRMTDHLDDLNIPYEYGGEEHFELCGFKLPS